MTNSSRDKKDKKLIVKNIFWMAEILAYEHFFDKKINDSLKKRNVTKIRLIDLCIIKKWRNDLFIIKKFVGT